MATVFICDGGCGSQSPDPKSGLHEANHWLRVRTGENHRFERVSDYDDLLFCKLCEPRILAALTPAAKEGGEA